MSKEDICTGELEPLTKFKNHCGDLGGVTASIHAQKYSEACKTLGRLLSYMQAMGCSSRPWDFVDSHLFVQCPVPGSNDEEVCMDAAKFTHNLMATGHLKNSTEGVQKMCQTLEGDFTNMAKL